MWHKKTGTASLPWEMSEGNESSVNQVNKGNIPRSKKTKQKKNYIRGQRQVWESPQSFGQQVLTKYSGYWETKSIWLVVMSPAQRPSLLPISVCRDKVTLERSLLVMYSSSAKASLQPQPPN